METNIVEFEKRNWIWRIQTSSDIQNGDLSTLQIAAYYKTVWVDPEGKIINEIKAEDPIIVSALSGTNIVAAITVIQQYIADQMVTQEPNY